MVDFAALRARLKGCVPRAEPALGPAVNVGALVEGAPAIGNMTWSSRTPGTASYDDWIVEVSVVVLIGVGVLYLPLHRNVVSRNDAETMLRSTMPSRRA